MIFGKVVVPWKDAELEALKEIAPRSTSKQELAARFPNRSYKAVACKLTAIRHELGVGRAKPVTTAPPPVISRVTILHPKDPGVRDGEFSRRRRLASIASEQMLAALGARRYG
jgi:hypothetical protein